MYSYLLSIYITKAFKNDQLNNDLNNSVYNYI